MANGDLRDEILQLEARIERLCAVMENCRKVILIAKVAIAAGGTWLSALMLGVAGVDPMGMIGALALLIGGIVVFGSNTSTAKQSATAIREAETLRADLIEKINPRTVREIEGD
jgi:hypothetical protein